MMPIATQPLQDLQKKTYVVIPAYNEGKTVGSVLDNLLKNGWKNVVAVNDGSRDNTVDEIKKRDVHFASHVVNRGVGGALETGIRAALKLGADIVVTFDADGQHSVKDLEAVIRPISSGQYDAVIGSRLINPKGMPSYRRLMNRIANLVTYVLFQMKTTDSQSGLRAFSNKAANLLDIQANRMESSSEIIYKIRKHDIKFTEVPIQAIYTKYSLSKGQNLFEGIRTLAKLVVYKLV